MTEWYNHGIETAALLETNVRAVKTYIAPKDFASLSSPEFTNVLITFKIDFFNKNLS